MLAFNDCLPLKVIPMGLQLMVNIRGHFTGLVKWFILWSTTSIVSCKKFDYNLTDTCLKQYQSLLIWSTHNMEVSNLNTLYLRRLYEPANADSSLIQKTFINTQLPPVTSLIFCCTVRRINGAIHYIISIICTPSPSQLANLFLSYCFLLYFKWKIN